MALVEWPDRAGDEIPADALTLTLALGDDPTARLAYLSGDPDAWRDRLARSFRVRRLLDAAGLGGASRRFLQGDASSRSYERIRARDKPAVLMNWPEPPRGALLPDGRTYAEVAHIQTSLAAFLAVAETLRARGFVAPGFLAGDREARLLLLTDLGAEGIVAGGAPIAARYLASAEVLADLHGEDLPDTVDAGDLFGDGSPVVHSLPAYDRAALEIELSLNPQWWVPHVTGRPADPDWIGEFRVLCDPLLAALGRAETSWTLRDVHSPNLIWQPGETGRRRVGFVDVQDAMIGPAAYDLASLVFARASMCPRRSRTISSPPISPRGGRRIRTSTRAPSSTPSGSRPPSATSRSSAALPGSPAATASRPIWPMCRASGATSTGR
ncbi:Phosphotransferase enzyme family protein [Methylobrevis pamukkalensis]|uniref:Phosphotransferase enzyme family protein n=1 Tax=Methylobrevis pamukkalensis TaxID=1439726 RepID=A0A1E3GZ71_9HYPH|nr:Phosphotransferase enzyme family protein [Methylobrevis pamukkalensis]